MGPGLCCSGSPLIVCRSSLVHLRTTRLSGAQLENCWLRILEKRWINSKKGEPSLISSLLSCFSEPSKPAQREMDQEKPLGVGRRTQVCQVVAGGTDTRDVLFRRERAASFSFSHPLEWGQELWSPGTCRWVGVRWSKRVKTMVYRRSVLAPKRFLGAGSEKE